MNDLLGHDHTDLGESLSELFAALNAGDVEKSYERLDMFWARLAMHIRAEHLHLFPAILRTVEEHPPGADVHSQPRPEPVKPRMTLLDIARIERSEEFAQRFAQVPMVVSEKIVHALRFICSRRRRLHHLTHVTRFEKYSAVEDGCSIKPRVERERNAGSG